MKPLKPFDFSAIDPVRITASEVKAVISGQDCTEEEQQAWAPLLPNKQAVEHPAHYNSFPVEVIDMIKIILNSTKHLTPFELYCFGNEIKYRMRAGLKDASKVQEDIDKALMYKKFREETDLATVQDRLDKRVNTK